MTGGTVTAQREHSRLALGMSAAGGAAVALALAANVLGLGVSSGFGWKKSALLIAGCDLIVASLIVDARRTVPADDGDRDIASLLSRAIADGVMLFAISAAAVIVLFGQSKPIERLGYFLAIFVIVPLVTTLAWRRWRRGETGEDQQLLAFATLAATAGVLCLARLLALSPSGTPDTSLFVLIALVVVRAAIAIAARIVPATWPRTFPARSALAVTPLLLAAAAAPFVPSATLSVVDVAVALAAALATFDLVRAFAGRWRLPKAWVRIFDICVVVISTLVVLYIAAPTVPEALDQNYFLGPATDVLHGHAMLVSTFSQYGVGLMDVLAVIFLVLPIGYGTFTLLLSVSTALFFAGFYLLLRWSTRSLFIAAAGLTVAVILDIFGQSDFYTYFPSTGVLRFGLPWLVILLALAPARMPARKRLFDASLFAVIGVSAVWSGETGVYCLGTALALTVVDAATADAYAHVRIRMAVRRGTQLIATSAAALLTFTLLTRVCTGAWPDWGGYLYYVRLYTTEGFGNLPIEPWSPGLALGAMYTASALVVVLLVLTQPAFVRERIVAFRAVSGLTVLGAIVYTYFLGRAHPNNLIHISPPAVALLFVWLGIAHSTFVSRRAFAIASATVVFLGALIVASEGADISEKYPSTALAAVLGTGPSLTSAVSTLWNNPVLDPTAAHVVAFVAPLKRRYGSVTLLLTPYVETEALLRLAAANAVGSSNPCQLALSTEGPGQIAEAVRSLRPGGVVVTGTVANDGGELLPIEQYTLALLGARFAMQEISADGKGLHALQLVRLSAAATHAPPAPAPRTNVMGGCG